MSISFPASTDDLELAWLREDYAEGWGKTGKAIVARNRVINPNIVGTTGYGYVGASASISSVDGELIVTASGAPSLNARGTVQGQFAPDVFRMNFEPGDSGVFMATVRVPSNYTVAGEYSAARCIYVSGYLPNGTATVSYAVSGKTPPGETADVVLPFTIPDDSRGVYFTLGAGSAVPTDFVAFSNIAAIKKEDGWELSDHPFSGATPDDSDFEYEWEGTANSSTSVKKSLNPVQFFERSTIGDLEFSYWSKRSNLTPVGKFTIADHMLSALRNGYVETEGSPVTDPDHATLTDLLMAFYMANSGLEPGPGITIVDHERAMYMKDLDLV